MQPVRRIANENDLALFHESKTYEDVVDFVLKLNSAAKGCENGITEPVSSGVAALQTLLDKVVQTVEKNPAMESDSRFGKPEFRGVYSELEQHSADWIQTGFPKCSRAYAEELAGYFTDSFGNKTRIDYGSGHELNFICFLLCLTKLQMLQDSDMRNVVNGVFFKYLNVMRLLQRTYWLEPAGSHGVWGLDDYHFLPFMFGSSQLLGDPYVRPISIHDEDIVDMYKEKNMYFWCISFINRVKHVSLRWHSPMLDDISGVKRWEKVNEGMVKMYKAEVLGKLPIVQHFLFGELLPAPENATPALDIGEDIHVKCWADCCGIRVPSAIAASGDKPQGHLLRKTAAVPLD